MKAPIDPATWLVHDETGSTQHDAAQEVRAGSAIRLVMAHSQTAGRGRFDRIWLSPPGESLSMSLILSDYADHPQPWLVGMSVAIAVAGAVHGQVRWPNDVSLRGKKVAGILSELVPGPDGRKVPVVGVGVNLNQREFPAEIAETATSLLLASTRPAVEPVEPAVPPPGERAGKPAPKLVAAPPTPMATFQPTEVARAILKRLGDLPEPNSWDTLRPIWMLFDATPGKKYRLPSGEEALAIGLGPNGELICSVQGETQVVMAGDALFGT